MAAMMLTAVSYGRMAARYPAAGSAYPYEGRGLDPRLGFLSGWSMALDYVLIPVINTAYVSLTMQRLAPAVPFLVWAALVAAAMTLLNLRGIRWTARANGLLLAGMTAAIALFLALAARSLFRGGWSGLFSLEVQGEPADTLEFVGIQRVTVAA